MELDLDGETKTWEVSNQFINQETKNFIFNDVSLKNLAGHALLNSPITNRQPIFSESTKAEILKVATEVNRPAEEASMKIDADKATEFNPGQNGLAINLRELALNLVERSDKTTLPVLISYPKTALVDTNNLGIIELVGRGESNFAGSPANRRVNIRVGAEKYHGLIIKPGQEFSFNEFLGDVDAAHGFLPELVIKRDGLKPEFGGGLCQVSSTAFRAAMNSGLPIVERKNHSFAVQYYAPQGTDATIYPGSVDLRFLNNLKSHLLIQTRIVGNKLYFDFYGTKDDRLITFEGPSQYDRKPDGSLKAVWSRKVTLNGKTSEQVFRSNYVSPNLYKKESTVQSSTPNPESNQNPTPTPTPTPSPTLTPTPTS